MSAFKYKCVLCSLPCSRHHINKYSLCPNLSFAKQHPLVVWIFLTSRTRAGLLNLGLVKLPLLLRHCRQIQKRQERGVEMLISPCHNSSYCSENSQYANRAKPTLSSSRCKGRGWARLTIPGWKGKNWSSASSLSPSPVLCIHSAASLRHPSCTEAREETHNPTRCVCGVCMFK